MYLQYKKKKHNLLYLEETKYIIYLINFFFCSVRLFKSQQYTELV